MQHRIRPARLLVRDNTVLLIKHTMNGRTFWVPPGGGLEIVDATTRDTVIREIKEKAGGDEHMISEARFVHRDELASMRVYPKELADDLWARIEQPIIHPLHLGVQVEGDDADF